MRVQINIEERRINLRAVCLVLAIVDDGVDESLDGSVGWLEDWLSSGV
jgi:hypothetical protein